MRLSRRVLTLLATPFLAVTATVVINPPHAAAANTAYVMSYFTESPQMAGANHGLHLAVSQDGANRTTGTCTSGTRRT